MPERRKKRNELTDTNNPAMDSSIEKVEVDLRFMKPGSMLVGVSFDKRGHKIKEANEPFTEADINSLLEKGITKLYYIPERARQGLNLPKVVEDQEEQIEIIENKDFLTKQQSLRELVRQSFEKIKKEEPIDVPLLKTRLNNLLTDLLSKKKFIVKLLSPERKEGDFGSEMIFTHSVNVSILSLITSLHFRLKREVIIDVALAGLLHDIGISKINPAILEKESDLTEEEFISVKQHPAHTVNILKNIEGISKNILYMCLQHHETIDGSGYPKNLTGKEILPLSQIISISEMYDALTSRKPYCKTISTSQAILYFYMTSGKHYHRKIANSFIKAIYERMRMSEIFPLGSRIILNTNEIAIVMEETKNSIRPIIEIVKDSRHENLKRPIPVDLNNEPSREIIRVLKLPSGEDTLPEAKIILKHFF